MAWTDATWWWVVTGVLVAAELATGTFFLLMLAIGSAAAALAAHAGASFNGQLVAAALVGGGAVAYWFYRRSRQPPRPAPSADRNVNLDVGERVLVEQWASDGTSRVHYRGASWSARWAGSGAPQPGEHVIRAVEGSRLLLDRAH
jgi:membrane protein implicated in regulation of membrane protease activity